MFLRRALLLICAIAFAALWLNSISRSERVAIAVGQPLTDVRAELSDGSVFRLDEQRGQVTVLNFWASWCGPCKHEVPALRRLKHEGTRVIGLSIEELPPSTVGEQARTLGIDYPVGKPEAGLIERLRVNMVPTTAVIDARGTVRAVVSGEVSYEDLRAAVADASRH